MDEMQEYEVNILMKNINISSKQEWERTRYIIWASLKPYLKRKSMTPQELLPMAWDEAKSSTTSMNLNDEQINAMRKFLMNNRK